MKYLFKQFNKNTILDFLIIMFFSHIFYRFTFIETLQNEFSLISQIKNNNVTSKSFFVESPTFTLIGLLLGIENIDIYKILNRILDLKEYKRYKILKPKNLNQINKLSENVRLKTLLLSVQSRV